MFGIPEHFLSTATDPRSRLMLMQATHIAVASGLFGRALYLDRSRTATTP
jgi:hypothetical protein